MSHTTIYTCDFCGKEIDASHRHMVTLPHVRYQYGGGEKDVCEGCANEIEELVIGFIRRKRAEIHDGEVNV